MYIYICVTDLHLEFSVFERKEAPTRVGKVDADLRYDRCLNAVTNKLIYQHFCIFNTTIWHSQT